MSEAEQKEVTEIDVRFDSGHEVLGAYWGFLSNGGLVIANDESMAVGNSVLLRVSIRSVESSYELRGRIVRRHSDGARMVVAFEPGQPHDMLLTDALAETDNVPPRQHRRYMIDVDAQIGGSPEAVALGQVAARVVNVSEGGMCLRFETGSNLPVGSAISVRAGTLSLSGIVAWSRNREVGVQFGHSGAPERHPEALDLIQSYLGTLGG